MRGRSLRSNVFASYKRVFMIQASGWLVNRGASYFLRKVTSQERSREDLLVKQTSTLETSEEQEGGSGLENRLVYWFY